MKALGTKRLKLKCDKLLSTFAFNINLRRHNVVSLRARNLCDGGSVAYTTLRVVPPGEAVQLDPIEPTLKAPGTKRLKLKCDELLSSFASNINLRRYTP